ncbi:hypothetical protein [Streptomyces sp. NPDC048825]|uniref:hypothetical protein n=1 Tax=Streptomyces sp. NPDC048825 TaxID=3365592 RepID=UPI003711981B
MELDSTTPKRWSLTYFYFGLASALILAADVLLAWILSDRWTPVIAITAVALVVVLQRISPVHVRRLLFKAGLTGKDLSVDDPRNLYRSLWTTFGIQTAAAATVLVVGDIYVVRRGQDQWSPAVFWSVAGAGTLLHLIWGHRVVRAFGDVFGLRRSPFRFSSTPRRTRTFNVGSTDHLKLWVTPAAWAVMCCLLFAVAWFSIRETAESAGASHFGPVDASLVTAGAAAAAALGGALFLGVSRLIRALGAHAKGTGEGAKAEHEGHAARERIGVERMLAEADKERAAAERENAAATRMQAEASLKLAEAEGKRADAELLRAQAEYLRADRGLPPLASGDAGTNGVSGQSPALPPGN